MSLGVVGAFKEAFGVLDQKALSVTHKRVMNFRERKVLSFSLVFRDENKNFCLSVSCFETRENFFIQPPVSRQEREFLSFSRVRVNFSNFLKIVCNFSREI